MVISEKSTVAGILRPVLNAYGCAVCGYIEFMVPDHRMDTFHKILRKWTKIEPNS